MVKNLPANAGDAVSIPGSGRSPGEGNGNSLQYSCSGSPRDTEAWQATVHGQLINHAPQKGLDSASPGCVVAVFKLCLNI